MKRFIFTFTGREVGAIGIFHHCNQIVTAEDRRQAELMLYDTHDHISNLDCVGEYEVTA